MSGLIVITIAGLLTQEAVPHPSSLATYRAPVIRPFEPGRDFGREPSQGDAEAGPYRRPLDAPVTVEAYVGSYEFMPVGSEVAYEQGVNSAEIRADQTAGQLDGVWRIVDPAGRTLYELALNDPGVGPIEGGWRGASRWGGAASDGTTVSLEGLGAMTLERAGADWRGWLTIDGHARAVSLIRPN